MPDLDDTSSPCRSCPWYRSLLCIVACPEADRHFSEIDRQLADRERREDFWHTDLGTPFPGPRDRNRSRRSSAPVTHL